MAKISEEAKATLRQARSLATTLRNLLEEVQSDIDSGFAIISDDHPDKSTTSLFSGIDDNAEAAGEIESWLDSLKINEDGTSADEGQ